MNNLNSCYRGNQNIIPSAISQKNGIFNEKGIFKVNHLLPARQNMNNFKHILHNIHLQYKHKIIVLKFLIIFTMATGIAKNGLTL